MPRLGLCCAFRDQPIKFPTTTATALERLKRREALHKLDQLCWANAEALRSALQFCVDHQIGAFRINSQILPLKTHPTVGYSVHELPRGSEIVQQFEQCGQFAQAHNVRTSFHPDQFVVLNSPRADVVVKSIDELEYQAEVAEWVQADVINIHAGGAYGDKPAALGQFSQNLSRLSQRVRSRLTLENDDKTYTPRDLLDTCLKQQIPLVYDVHHHRCHGDDWTVEQATQAALSTWNREPLFHLSSPLQGWQGPQPARHHDYIDPQDFPAEWLDLAITVEVEAKAKELAVFELARSLAARTMERQTVPGAWSVYVLRCRDETLYTGVSNNLPARLRKHQAGTGARYTRGRLPVELLYSETLPSRSLALKRELAIKRMSRSEKMALIAASRQEAITPAP